MKLGFKHSLFSKFEIISKIDGVSNHNNTLNGVTYVNQ